MFKLAVGIVAPLLIAAPAFAQPESIDDGLKMPCAAEYRQWLSSPNRTKPFPQPATATRRECADVKGWIDAEEDVRSRAPKDVAEPNSVPCLGAYRMWKLIVIDISDFEDALANSSFFRSQSPDECRAARAVDDSVIAQQILARARLREQELAQDQEEARLEAQRERAAARQARAIAAKPRLPGVRIGMTVDDVLHKTHWGRPQSRHRTTTAAGTTEQWIYGSGNYLYFENGRLTAIQN